jgi:hypothetical protein
MYFQIRLIIRSIIIQLSQRKLGLNFVLHYFPAFPKTTKLYPSRTTITIIDVEEVPLVFICNKIEGFDDHFPVLNLDLHFL